MSVLAVDLYYNSLFSLGMCLLCVAPPIHPCLRGISSCNQAFALKNMVGCGLGEVESIVVVNIYLFVLL
jgi:hypothetical protein